MTSTTPPLKQYHCLLKTPNMVTLLVFLLLIYFPFSFFGRRPQVLQAPVSSRGFLLEEIKARLGSIPPSCHNKCNGCHPCMAVQVPTLPSHNHIQPGSTPTAAATTNNAFCDPNPPGNNNNRYSNYKPLRWKCRCGDLFYNP